MTAPYAPLHTQHIAAVAHRCAVLLALRAHATHRALRAHATHRALRAHATHRALRQQSTDRAAVAATREGGR